MRCWKCFRDTFVIHITTEHHHICDTCYDARKRVLARIRVKRKSRKAWAEARAAIHKLLDSMSPRA